MKAGTRVVLAGLFTVAVITPSSAQSSDAPKVHSAGFPPDLTLGDETAVHCVVKKAVTGPVLLSWRKDGADVQSNDRLTVSRPTASSSMISIRRIEPEDVGNYTCTASSVQGSSEVMVPLVVIGKYMPGGSLRTEWEKQIFLKGH